MKRYNVEINFEFDSRRGKGWETRQVIKGLPILAVNEAEAIRIAQDYALLESTIKGTNKIRFTGKRAIENSDRS